MAETHDIFEGYKKFVKLDRGFGANWLESSKKYFKEQYAKHLSFDRDVFSQVLEFLHKKEHELVTLDPDSLDKRALYFHYSHYFLTHLKDSKEHQSLYAELMLKLEAYKKPGTELESHPPSSGKSLWHNCIENQVVYGQNYFEPTSLFGPSDSIESILRQYRHVRVTGNGHSYSNAVQVCSDTGTLIRLVNLVKFAGTSITGCLNPNLVKTGGSIPLATQQVELSENPTETFYYVEMEAGITIKNLNLDLYAWNLALKNMGGYDGQAIMGCIATSTHGSGISLPPFCDAVKSLVIATTGHLCDEDSSKAVNYYRIEPTNGITNPQAYSDLQKTNPTYAAINLIQDDDIFNSVTCSMGCFGIVYSVVMEVCQSYYLTQTRELVSLSDLMDNLLPNNKNPNNVCDLLNNNRHVEIYVNPYPMVKHDLTPKVQNFKPADVQNEYPNVTCLLTIRNYSPKRYVSGGPSKLEAIIQECQSLYHVLAKLLNCFPSLSPYAILIANNTLLHNSDNYTDLSFNIFNLGTPANAGYACEFGYPLFTTDCPDYSTTSIQHLNNNLIINAQNMRIQKPALYHTSPYSLRFVQQSNSYLSMSHEQATMMCEIDTLISTGIEKGQFTLMDQVETLVLKDQNCRVHWGLDFDKASSIKGYPKYQNWIKNYAKFNKKNTFSGPFTTRFHLDALVAAHQEE